MLKQQTEDRHAPWKHTPPATPSQEERFDKDATQDILQTAARLQQAEQDTLSQAEIEAMAAEMGISPRHVRKAIALSGRATKTRRLQPVDLSPLQKIVIAATVLLYSACTGLLTAANAGAYNQRWEWILLASVFVLPFVIPFALGIYVCSKRAGAVAGGLLTTLMFFFMQIVMVYRHSGDLLRNGGFWYALMIICGAVVAGTAGAALRQWLTSSSAPRVQVRSKPWKSDR